MRTKRFFTLALVWLVVTCAVTYGQKPFSAILAGASYIPENVENDRQERLTLMNGGTLKAFNVVCGSSDNVKEANKLCKKLVSKGYSAQVTQNQEIGKYRVIAASFNDRDLAVQARNKLRSAYPDAWLLYNVHPTMASSSSSSTPSLLSNLTFEAPKKIIRPTGEWVNIRTAPSTSAPKARIPGTDFTKGASKYDLLPVEDENAGWYRIGRNEWISKQVTRPALCKPITDAMLNRFFGYSESYDDWAEWMITPVAKSDFYLMYAEAPMTLYLGKLVGNVFVFKYGVILDVAKYEEPAESDRCKISKDLSDELPHISMEVGSKYLVKMKHGATYVSTLNFRLFDLKFVEYLFKEVIERNSINMQYMTSDLLGGEFANYELG